MSGLEHLLAQATPAPWEPLDDESELVTVVPWVGKELVDGQLLGVADAIENPHDARLIALAPDAVRLLIDMAAWADYAWGRLDMRYATDESVLEVQALLERFAALNQKAGTA